MTTRIFHRVDSTIGKDDAVSQIAVTLDPAKWSKRKKNIIVESLRTGIASCGWATAALVRHLTESINASTLTVTKWGNSVSTDFIKPEKLDDLMAYTAAWVRMAEANDPYFHRKHTTANASYFLGKLNRGDPIYDLPLPTGLTHDQKRAFLAEFIREPTEHEAAARANMVRMIETDTPITITFN